MGPINSSPNARFRLLEREGERRGGKKKQKRKRGRTQKRRLSQGEPVKERREERGAE